MPKKGARNRGKKEQEYPQQVEPTEQGQAEFTDTQSQASTSKHEQGHQQPGPSHVPNIGKGRGQKVWGKIHQHSENPLSRQEYLQLPQHEQIPEQSQISQTKSELIPDTDTEKGRVKKVWDKVQKQTEQPHIPYSVETPQKDPTNRQEHSELPQPDRSQPIEGQQTQLPKKVLDTKQLDLSKLSIKDQSISTSSCKTASLTISKQQAFTQSLNIPNRKNPNKAGSLGRPITVLTNMMRIHFGKNFQSKVIHYDVDIVPNLPKYLMRDIFGQVKKKLFPNKNPAFDGKKSAFSAGYLPISSPVTTTVTVFNENGREKQYNVTLKIANEIDISWLKDVNPGLQETERNQISLQALDVILRSAPALRSITVGRSFFSPPQGQIHSLGDGMDLWVGLFQSAILGWKPYLNVDVVHKGFPKPQSVLNLIKTICGCDEDQAGQFGRGNQQGGYRPQAPLTLNASLINYNQAEITKFLIGLKITTEVPGQPTSRRTQKCNGLVKCARDNTFECNGKLISVEQYYRLEKNYNIKYPDFPCLWVGAKEKNIHVPLEICTIVGGQSTQKKLNERQTASMVRYAATPTRERKEKIMNAFKSMQYHQDPCMKEFDISISGEFEKVPARVLDPPQLSYSGKITNVTKGIWRPEKFLKPCSLIADDNSWTILNLNQKTPDNALYNLVTNLTNAGRSAGMLIGKPVTPFKPLQIRGADIRNLISYFEEQKRKNLKLIIVIVPETKGYYSKVKQVTELTVGLLTQCLKGKTLMKIRGPQDSTIVNILLKINAKLNGVNHSLEVTKSRPKCMMRPCMVVGADVTHPSPDATDIPSIAAVAASHDPNAFRYNVEIRLQPPRQEIIENLTEIMISQLQFFYSQTKCKPERIIFYRDGVSEGQFGQVMHAELMAIRRACQKLNVDYKPKITFLVVQKRHHIRLFPTDPKNSDDKNLNVQAGTVVDTNITHPSHIDFYLVSHASIQGTARPTKYRCLWDDSDMNEDEIENLTYFLCHMFSRCTRSVSYPTPTYYAHLAAFRARALTEDVSLNLNNLQEEQLKKLTVKTEVLKNTPMFFV